MIYHFTKLVKKIIQLIIKQGAPQGNLKKI